MENQNKLGLERTQKLQIFAVMSARKTVPQELLKNSFALCVLASYTEAEAMIGVGHGLTVTGQNINDYTLGVMRVAVDVDSLIDTRVAKPTVSKKEDFFPIIVDKKTAEEKMVDDVRIMFNLVGSKEQQKVAELVIEKFKGYVANRNLSTGKA